MAKLTLLELYCYIKKKNYICHIKHFFCLIEKKEETDRTKKSDHKIRIVNQKQNET